LSSGLCFDEHFFMRHPFGLVLLALATLTKGPLAVALSGLACPQTNLVDGDARCATVAAASIIAKVTRDRIMVEIDAQFPEYGFARHKGYATPDHLAALDAHGPCPLHRRSFISLWKQGELFPAAAD